MMLRVICVLIVLVSALEAAAQEPEYYYPYQTESEERTQVLLTDSVLFYRAVQSPQELYGRITDYSLSFVRGLRRGVDEGSRSMLVEGLGFPMRYITPLRALGGVESAWAGLESLDDRPGGVSGGRALRFDDSEPLHVGRTALYFSGRNYLGGLRFSYGGEVGRGWSYAASADLRTGRDMLIDGVFTNAATISVRLSKGYTVGHRLFFAVVVPPSMRGLRSMSTDEAFSLTGDRLYNPAWGYQNGEVRNSHVRRDFIPLAIAGGEFLLSPTTRLNLSLGVEAGISKWSTLGWYDARTPIPDNYRYLPSYVGDRETEQAWRMNDTRYTQIDWDEMWRENRMAAGEAVYALEDRVERTCRVQFNAGFVTRFDDRLTLNYGVWAHYDSSRNYKQMRDLMGAEYVTDIDQFLVDDDTFGNQLQNNMRNPNRKIGQGDRFGYDYALNELQAGVRVVMRYRADRFRADFGGEIGEVAIHRRGYFEKELFPGELSFGRSASLRFTPYTLKLSVGWAFSPRSYLGCAVATVATAPEREVLFIQPQYNNRTADSPQLKSVWSAELTYNYTGRVVDLQAAAFFNSSRRGMEAYRYYDDLAGVFSNMTASGLGVRSYGVEAAATFRLAWQWQLSLAGSAGRYEYAADPHLLILADADNQPVEITKSRMGGCTVGNAPQITASVQVAYFGRKGWGFRLSANYAGLRYVEPALLRRTERVMAQAAQTPEAFDRFTEQERLDDAFTLDGSLFKSFYINSSRLTLSLSVRNLLGSRDMTYAAYESMRVQRVGAGAQFGYAPFESRRMYAYPRSFYLTISYLF